jgi:hypothetical protein
MTKAELLDALSDYHDDDLIVVNVHDTELYEDNYDFYVDGIVVGRELIRHPSGHQSKDRIIERYEIHITPINHRHYNT